MSFAEILVGMLEIFALFMFVSVWWVEHERWPTQYRKWTPYMKGSERHSTYSNSIVVGVRHRDQIVALKTLDPRTQDFSERLYEAQSEARQRCIELNVARRGLRRRLPR